MIRKRKISKDLVAIETYYWTAESGGEIEVIDSLTKYVRQNNINTSVTRANDKKALLQQLIKEDEIVKVDAELADIADTQSVMDGEISKDIEVINDKQ